MSNPYVELSNVLREFACRMICLIREWFKSIGEYKQMQFFQATIIRVMNALYEEFIGDFNLYNKQVRQ